jgi:hypothetical protein
MPAKKTTDQFIADAIKVHGNKYDYSKVDYNGNSKKVIITCKEHGDYLKAPDKHLAGQGCRICKGYIQLTQQSFIDRAKKTHGNLYDYSKCVVKSKKDKVTIICKIHGSFEQLPSNHYKGQGCPQCGQLSRGTSQRYSLDEFLQTIQTVHGDRYDYSKVNYINSQTKIDIICKRHGMFQMKANSHFNGQGCPKCGRIEANKNIALDYETFIIRASEVHGSSYIYDESSYSKLTSKMRILCAEHGWFHQTPHSHISMQSGCPKCGKLKAAQACKLSWNKVLSLFRETHGDKYQYDKATYSDVSTKMKITCSKHGDFWQNPYGHYGGSGCVKCGYEEGAEANRISLPEFIERSKMVHGDKYDYTNVSFSDSLEEVEIICPKHGSFMQVMRYHYYGSGCQKCNSSRGETSVRLILQKRKLKFIEQKTFDDLTYKGKLKCDFFIPELNTVIEYNGRQHYIPVDAFGGIKALEQNQKRDSIKYDYLHLKGINLIIVRYDVEDVNNYLSEKLDNC